jgi:hypothetical protein
VVQEGGDHGAGLGYWHKSHEMEASDPWSLAILGSLDRARAGRNPDHHVQGTNVPGCPT